MEVLVRDPASKEWKPRATLSVPFFSFLYRQGVVAGFRIHDEELSGAGEGRDERESGGGTGAGFRSRSEGGGRHRGWGPQTSLGCSKPQPAGVARGVRGCSGGREGFHSADPSPDETYFDARLC